MIRLWNRVGGFRVFAVALLLLGVVGGVALHNHRTTQQNQAAAAARAEAARINDEEASRARREAQEKADAAAATAAKQAKAAAEATKPTTKPSAQPTTSSPPVGPIPASCNEYTGNRAIGCALLLQMGFGLDQMPCLDKLWTKESRWRVEAYNRSSGATGIPQALPGDKMASAGADWRTNPATQIRWGLGYIKGRYKTPCNAWNHSVNTGWY